MANYNQLKTRAQQVRDEQTIGGNTALRVGQLLMDMVDAESETVDNIVELFTGTEDNPVIPTLPNPGLLHWLQSPIVALVSMGEDLDGDAGAVVQEGDLYYYNHSGYQIFVKGSGSLPGTGYKARQKVLYLNKYTGKLYEWTGSIMTEITLAGTGGGGGGGGGDITVDSSLSSSSRNPVQNRVITAALGNKQDKLTFDNAPTANSNNPVQSGGVYTALAGKQDTIADLATIRTGAGKGATALQPQDVSVESPSTPDGTFTLNVGSNEYNVNLNHTHQNMAKLVVCEESDLPSTLDPATIYAQVDDEETPTEIQSLWIAGLEFVGGGGVPGQPRVTSPANGSTIDIGYNDGTGVSDTITVKGKDLTSGLTVAISGTGFSLTYGQSTGQSSISIAQADALLGAQVTIVNSGSGRATDGVLVISHGNDVLSTVSVETSLLPSGYTKLDYIENIVKGLDTGIKATNSTTIDSSASGSSWEVDVQCNSTPSSGQMILCTNEDVAHWLQVMNTGNYGISGGNNLSASITSRNVITVAFTGGGISASIGNETVTRAYTYMNKYSVCLFENINYTMSQYGGGVFTVGRIYGAKCTSGGSFNGVPAKRNSDNHFGLYDTANSVFYDLSSNS